MYEIGQKVVCVETHPDKIVLKDHVYKVKDIMISPCACKTIALDVGIIIESHTLSSCYMQHEWINTSTAWWVAASRFRPIDDLYNEEIKELTEALNEPVTF